MIHHTTGIYPERHRRGPSRLHTCDYSQQPHLPIYALALLSKFLSYYVDQFLRCMIMLQVAICVGVLSVDYASDQDFINCKQQQILVLLRTNVRYAKIARTSTTKAPSQI